MSLHRVDARIGVGSAVAEVGDDRLYRRREVLHPHRAAGQTLYSIARLYGVSEQTLVAYNPTMADVLKADQNVKIPVPAPQMQPDEAPLTARQEKKLRKKFILHTVEAHETLYAISKRYGISVETLLEDNENLDPTHLTIGGTLLVRKRRWARPATPRISPNWKSTRRS